ncbi:MAG: inositol monophosphatase family protein [Candidatus Limnocylindrales bacterium]
MTETISVRTDLLRWRDTALALCDEADAISMAGFRGDIGLEAKPDGSFVTEVDRSIERLLRERIRAAYPDCGLVGEEEGSDRAEASVCWYVDPIDATHNYMRGIPIFATLLAVAVDGEVQLGVVSAPALRERWVAWRGGGAWRGSGRIAVSRIATIAESTLLYGSRTEDMRSGLMPGLDATLAEAWRERGLGDFWGYMLVAEGAAEAMIETGAHSWDWAAPQVIVEEAGGRFTTASGERTINGTSAVASNGLIHDELLGRLRESR